MDLTFHKKKIPALLDVFQEKYSHSKVETDTRLYSTYKIQVFI
jgi:hypothetical protein